MRRTTMMAGRGSYSPYLLFINSARESELFHGDSFDHCQQFGVERGALWKAAPPVVQDFFQSLADSAEMVARNETETLTRAAALAKPTSDKISIRRRSGDDGEEMRRRGRKNKLDKLLSERLKTKVSASGKFQEVMKRLIADSTIREAFTVSDLAPVAGATSAAMKGHSQFDQNHKGAQNHRVAMNAEAERLNRRNHEILAKKEDTFFGNLVTKPETRHLEPALRAFIVMNKANPDPAFIEQCEFLWNRKEKDSDESKFAARFNNLRNFESFCSHAVTKFPKCHGMMQNHSQWPMLGNKLVNAFIMDDMSKLGAAKYNWRELRIHSRPGFYASERICKEVSVGGAAGRAGVSYRAKTRQAMHERKKAGSTKIQLPTKPVPTSAYTLGNNFKDNKALLKFLRSSQVKHQLMKADCIYAGAIKASAKHRPLVSQKCLERNYKEFGSAHL